MRCTITNERTGQLYSHGITQGNEKIKVLFGHLFYGKTIDVEKYNDDFYHIKKLDYDENKILSKHADEDGLVHLKDIKEANYVSKPYKRIYEIDNYWLFVAKPINEIL